VTIDASFWRRASRLARSPWRLGFDLPKTLSFVRLCTDTIRRKSLGFLIVGHLQYAQKPDLIGVCLVSRQRISELPIQPGLDSR
jgi:hypothetical protein